MQFKDRIQWVHIKAWSFKSAKTSIWMSWPCPGAFLSAGRSVARFAVRRYKFHARNYYFPPYGLNYLLFMQALHNFTRFKSVDQDKSTRQVFYLVIYSFFSLTKKNCFNISFQQWRLIFIDKEIFFLTLNCWDCCSKVVVTFFSVSVTLWPPLKYS